MFLKQELSSNHVLPTAVTGSNCEVCSWPWKCYAL